MSGSSGLIARFANETSNLAAGRGQPVATPGPARPAHRIQSVWVRLVTTRQKLDCLPFALIVGRTAGDGQPPHLRRLTTRATGSRLQVEKHPRRSFPATTEMRGRFPCGPGYMA